MSQYLNELHTVLSLQKLKRIEEADNNKMRYQVKINTKTMPHVPHQVYQTEKNSPQNNTGKPNNLTRSQNLTGKLE